MDVRLDGQVALVTGGLGAIGTAIATSLEAAGAAVVRTDLAEVVDGSASQRLRPHDVTSAAGWAAVVEHVEREVGSLDILCNAAGIRSPIEPIEQIPADTWRRVMDVNATGCLLGHQAVLPAMKRRRQGKIVNLSSTLGKDSLGGSAAYGASKHAVIALTQSASYEAGPFNINVNAVCPGPVDTPLLRPLDDPASGAALVERLGALASLGRIVDPEDVAALVTFLCSELARNIHGQAINVDAGRSVHT